MKLQRRSGKLQPGYVSYVLVLSTGMMLTMITMSAYRNAAGSQIVQSETQLRVDYADKEDAVLRAVVNIVPNRAIRAMQHRSNVSGVTRYVAYCWSPAVRTNATRRVGDAPSATETDTTFMPWESVSSLTVTCS